MNDIQTSKGDKESATVKVFGQLHNFADIFQKFKQAGGFAAIGNLMDMGLTHSKWPDYIDSWT